MIKSIYHRLGEYVNNRRNKLIINRLGGVILGNVDFYIKGVATFGNNLKISGRGIDSIQRSQIYVAKDAELSFGNFSGMSQSSIYCTHKITIGDYVKIGAGCLIMDSNFHNMDWRIRQDSSIDTKSAIKKPVVIKDHAFIGARSIVCKGVTIGEHSIIAAGSVVVKDIPDNCIAGGNPCVVIRSL